MSDPSVPASLKQQMVIDEIHGKNNAVQTYDQQLWAIRSGFLTILFGGWGALLALAGDKPDLIVPVAVAMLSVSWGLAITGLFIDRNYVTRKFRCIYALRILLEEAFEKIDDPDQIQRRDTWMRVSGDDGTVVVEKTVVREPYGLALKLSTVLYTMPPLAITVGAVVSWLILNGSLIEPLGGAEVLGESLTECLIQGQDAAVSR